MTSVVGIVESITKPENPKKAVKINGAWVPRDQKSAPTMPQKGVNIVLEVNGAGFFTGWAPHASSPVSTLSSELNGLASLTSGQNCRIAALANAISLLELNVKKNAIEPSSITPISVIGVAKELEKYIQGGN